MDMDELRTGLETLADINLGGAPFLIAYGFTVLVCAYLWKTQSPKVASLATLFQGMVAFPLAMVGMYLIGAFEGDRPVPESISQLSILLGVSQFAVLPFLIYLFTRASYSLIPPVFLLASAVHFLPYAWLYQTWVYGAVAVTVAIGVTVVMGRDSASPSPRSAAGVCLLVGVVYWLAAAVLVLTHV